MDPSEISRPKTADSIEQDIGLRQRFVDLWHRHSLPGAASNPDWVWQELANQYAEHHRSYHNQDHLAFCLQQLDLAGDQVRHPDLVEMAIWFHDVIHRPGRDDNEQLSAAWFRDRADGVMAVDTVDAVCNLILVTTHKESPVDPEHQFICDIDLASFGSSRDRFLRNSDAVKAESGLPDEEFYPGERAFLNALLDRPRIFLTDYFYQRYEQQARDNIAYLLGLIDSAHLR